MLNFSNHYSLKLRFQSVVTALISNQTEQPSEYLQSLVHLIDCVIAGDRQNDSFENPNLQSQIRAVILGLYNHQDLTNLTEYFTEPEDLVIAIAIALCCRGEMQPRTLVNKLGNYLKEHPSFCSELNLANSLADQGSSREIAKTLISQDALAFGLYGFLSTPHTWNLVNQGLGHYQTSISAIAAAYLGYIPEVSTQDLKLATNLSDRLLAAWAGVYDLNNISANFYPSIKYPAIMSIGA